MNNNIFFGTFMEKNSSGVQRPGRALVKVPNNTGLILFKQADIYGSHVLKGPLHPKVPQAMHILFRGISGIKISIFPIFPKQQYIKNGGEFLAFFGGYKFW